MAISTDIERLNYYEGEYLGAVDFAAEQDYQRDMRRRHNVGQHTWGIVSGLEPMLTTTGSTSGGTAAQAALYLQPGMAIDGFGREIIVLNQTQITQDLFAAYYSPNPNAVMTMTIWITYTQQLIQPSQDACTSLNTNNPFGRVQETFQIVVTPAGTSPTDDSLTMDGSTIDPATVMAATPPATAADGSVLPPDLSISYQQFPTDDTGLFWYIPLGQVIWNANSGVFSASTDNGRLYAGAVAARVYAPAGSLIIQDRLSPYPLTDPTQNGVNVEVSGMLTVDRLFTAEEDAWIYEGGHLNFKNVSGTDGDTPLWLRRNTNASGGADLRIHIGDGSVAANQRLTIGFGPTNESTPDQIVMDVRADGNVDIPMGALGFGNQNSQMLNLAGTSYGLGVQPATLFFRSASDFAWYMGGTYSSKQDDPGSNGVLSMKLAASGDLSVNALNIDQAGANTGSLNPGLTFGTSASEGIASNQKGNANQGGLDFYTGFVAQMSITQQGQVGIGTKNPSLTLDIQGDFGRQNGNSTLHLYGSTIGDVGKGILFLRSGGNIVAFDGNDSVGIGTTSPSLTLDIQGDFGRQNGPSTLHLWGSTIADVGNGILSLRSGGSIVAFDGNDSVGIGTSSPQQNLSVVGGLNIDQGDQNNGTIPKNQPGPCLTFGSGSGEGIASKRTSGGNQWGLDFYTAFNTRMSINNQGQVGIGTLNPAYALDVNGSINATSAVSAVTKNFVIDHPLDPQGKQLIHGSLEGPETAVFYRGHAQLSDGQATIVLPAYFEALTRKENRTVLLTPKFTAAERISMLAASEIQDGKFTVRSTTNANPSQDFYWEVKAVRADVQVLKAEPAKISATAASREIALENLSAPVATKRSDNSRRS